MEEGDCDQGKLVGGAILLSHSGIHSRNYYKNNVECRITFKAEKDTWKLMMRVVELDLPDKSYSELCNDAVYVYDANTIIGPAVVSTIYLPYFCGYTCSAKLY